MWLLETKSKLFSEKSVNISESFSEMGVSYLAFCSALIVFALFFSFPPSQLCRFCIFFNVLKKPCPYWSVEDNISHVTVHIYVMALTCPDHSLIRVSVVRVSVIAPPKLRRYSATGRLII